jgi:transposase
VRLALVAIGRSLFVIIWHLLADPDTRYIDLGSDFYDTGIDPDTRNAATSRQLQALGYTVTIELAA